MANNDVITTLSEALKEVAQDISATLVAIDERERELVTLRATLERLEWSRDQHGAYLDHVSGIAPVEFEESHDVEQPIAGYDVSAWNVGTRQVVAVIADCDLTAQLQGMESDELEFLVMDHVRAHGHRIAASVVNWVELARYYGSEE